MIPDSMLWGLADATFDHVVVRAQRPVWGGLPPVPPRPPQQLHLICPHCGRLFERIRSNVHRCTGCGFLE